MKKNTRRYIVAFLLLLFLLTGLILLNINIGSVRISFREIKDILIFHTGEETQLNIIWKIRLPRIAAAGILGGALALSGFLLQTFFHNPIAGPYVLGVSSGAKLCVALTLICFLKKMKTPGSAVLIVAAFVGAMLSMGFVLMLAKRVSNMAMLVVCGVMIGYITSAVTDFIVTFAEESDIVNLHNWSLGSFSGMSWQNVAVMACVTAGAALLVLSISKPMSAYQLGEGYALSMGVNIKTFRIMLILLSSLLSACVTAFAGPISFVGIAVPHLMKSMFRTAKPLIMIPACFIGGSVFCLFSDLLARTLFAPTELSISSVTAILGAPVVIVLLVKRGSKN